MSKRKTNQSKPPARPVNKESIISVDPALTGRYRRIARNPLDDELASEDAMLARELKEMRVDELIMKRKARIAKLQKDLDELEKERGIGSGSDQLPEISVSMARQISQLPEEEQAKIIQTYALFRSMDQGKSNALLPMIVGFSRSNPGSSKSDMAIYAKAMADQFKTGVDVMKTLTPKEKSDSAVDLLKLFKDLVTDSVKKPMEELVKRTQAQPSAFEQILMNPEMFSRAKEIGMFGRPEAKTGSTSIDLEIEKLRGEREMSIKKLDLEWKKAMLEQDTKDRRTDVIMQSLAPLSAIFSGPAQERMRNLGRHSVQQNPNINPQNMPIPPQSTTILKIECQNCGYSGQETFIGPPPNTIRCPQCNEELIVGESQSES